MLILIIYTHIYTFTDIDIFFLEFEIFTIVLRELFYLKGPLAKQKIQLKER